jgi:hypothetical protein
MPEQVRVLFVAGTGRTGSTLVGNILGSVPGVESIGEVRHFWQRGVISNWNCGCGLAFDSCRFWRQILESAFGDPTDLDLELLCQSERQLLRLRKSWEALYWIRRPEVLLGRHGYYLWALTRLYQGISDVSGADFVVDSSKTPTYGALLATLPAIDLRVLHLIRDPRATAYSWLNPKPSPDRGESGIMDRVGAGKSAFLWAWWNSLAEALWAARPEIPAVRIQYEAMMSAPEDTLRSALEGVAPELAGRPLPIVGHKAELGLSHTVSGNPGRMERGLVSMEADERWRRGLALPHRALVMAIGGPAMLRYGYGRGHRARSGRIR